jgi:hypothetical protein
MFMFAAAMFVACFIYILASAPTAHAADAQWNGDSIMYGQNEYKKADVAKANDTRGIPEGSPIYAYVEPNPSGSSSPTTKAHLIYFAPGTDPPKTTTATYAVYNFTPPDTYTGAPTGKATLTLDPQVAASQGTTSCDSTFTMGIGWIVCPVTKFLASAMDHLFDILAGFLTVRPVQTNQENALYRAWSAMRNFANVSFVIAFLVIIYSQLTTIGLSNYDIKKMLPRLIVAAILVNISYWICAVAIDISNILGWSIQEIFISIRNTLVGSEGNGWNVTSWQSITGVILSGGTAVGATALGAYGLLVSAGTVGGALYMLLPILVGVLIAVLVALLIMAARQAIITILVIVSPLAFVAYLLPNTEKYFTKWRELGTTMLVLFPIFSVVFGGSQLAGMAIIQNADSINLIILGMGVQVAPVVITPLLVKFSGSLLARIGGIVNNPGKGLIDRTRKFAEERRDQRKARAFASPLNRRRDGIARLARNIDHNRRDREGNQKADEALGDANWAGTKRYSDIQQKTFDAKRLQGIGDARAETRHNEAIRTNAAAQNLELTARASTVKLDIAKARVEADWDEIKGGDDARIITPAGLAGSALLRYRQESAAFAQDVQHDTIAATVEANRAQSAQHVQKHQYSSALEASQALREQAGGIDSNGAQRALANALRERHEQRGEAVKNANSIIYHSNLSDEKILDVAARRATGLSFDVTDDVQEAAIKMVASSSNVRHIDELSEILDLSPAGNDNHRIAFVDELKKNNARPKFISSGKLNEMQQGIPGGLGKPGLDGMIMETMIDGKFAPEVIVQQDKYALERMVEAIRRNRASYSPTEVAALDRLKGQIREVYKSDLLKIKVGERHDALQDILNQ